MSNNNSFERQAGKKTSKSWPLRIFIVAINFFLVFLIIDVPIVVRISLWAIGFSIFLIFINYIRRRLSKNYQVEDDVKDLPPLTLKYIRINKKYLLASILGLTLAIAVISQIILLSSSGGGNIYANAFADGNLPLLEYEIYDSSLNSPNFTQIEDELRSKFNEITAEEGIKSTGLYTSYSYSFNLISQKQDNSNNPESPPYRQMNIDSDVLDRRFFNIIQQFPTFPNTLEFHENLTILVMDSYDIEQSNISQEAINDPSQLNFADQSGNMNLDIDYLWDITERDERYGRENNFYNIMWKIRNKLFVPLDQVESIFEEYDLRKPRSFFRAFIDPDSLKGRETDQVLQSLQSIQNKLYSFISSKGIQAGNQAEVIYRIRSIQDQETNLRFILLLVSAPMIGISMYLVYFSLNLVELRKHNLVAIMKIRGISSGQLKFMMMIESLIAAVIAIVLGMAISIPWTQHLLNITELYGANTTVFLDEEWYWTLPLVGLILALDLNIGSILSISSTSVEEGEQSEEKKEPFWRRFYLDVIFTVVGLTHWLVIRFVPFQPMIYNIILFTGIYSLPLLVIGLPLFVSRYYADFLSIVSDFLWKREGNLFALATRNMRRNKFSASKLAVLLMIGMMFSFVALGVPHSFNNWTYESAGYDVGADFRIDNIDTANTTQMEIINNQTGISATSEVKMSIIREHSGFQYNEIRILGIDPGSFEEVAFWQNDYADKKLSSLMKILEDDKILVQEDGMRITKIENGDNLVIERNSQTIDEEVGGSFKYWPRLLQYLYYSDTSLSQLAVVMPLSIYHDYFANTTNTQYNEMTNSVYAKAANNANQTQLHEGLVTGFTGTSAITINSISEQVNTLLQSTEITLLFSMMDTLLIITILTSIIGVGYFSFITLAERKREIGVFRAVGMVSKQIFILLVVESVILVSSSILIGILSGSFIASNLFLILGYTYGGSIPPIDLIYPTIKTIIFVLIALIASVVAAAIPARSTAQQQTGSILRAE